MQVREDAARDGFIYMPQEDDHPPGGQGMSPVGRGSGPLADLMYPFDFSKRGDDFFGMGGGAPTAANGAGRPAGSGGQSGSGSAANAQVGGKFIQID